MTGFKITDEVLKAALSAIVLEGEDVYHHIIFGLNDDGEDMRKTMTEEIVRAALEAALPVMFGAPVAWRYRSPGKSKWRLTDRGPINELMDSEPLYRLKEPK